MFCAILSHFIWLSIHRGKGFSFVPSHRKPGGTKSGKVVCVETIQTQKQAMCVSPKMIQAMRLFQMSTQELTEMLLEEAQSNPILELDESYSAVPLVHGFRELHGFDSNGWDRFGGKAEDPTAFPEKPPESLSEYLRGQIIEMRLPPAERKALLLLAESLDENGWLEDSIPDLSERFSFPPELLEQALSVLQSLEPTGVGARSLSECLILQLKDRFPEDKLAITLAENHLNELAAGHFSIPAESTGAQLDEVKAAFKRIQSLNPRPGNGFAAGRQTPYIVPDLLVKKTAGKLELARLDGCLPRLSLNEDYIAMAESAQDPAVKAYLSHKVLQAKWLLRTVNERERNLLLFASCILRLQEAFFLKGPVYLRPMSLRDVAREAGVHESTVSRTLRNKTIQGAFGVFSMSALFSRSLGQSEDGITALAAKELLRQLINSENIRQPLSDKELSTEMEMHGCAISRRTVAKYRQELGIPASPNRRRFP